MDENKMGLDEDIKNLLDLDTSGSDPDVEVSRRTSATPFVPEFSGSADAIVQSRHVNGEPGESVNGASPTTRASLGYAASLFAAEFSEAAREAQQSIPDRVFEIETTAHDLDAAPQAIQGNVERLTVERPDGPVIERDVRDASVADLPPSIPPGSHEPAARATPMFDFGDDGMSSRDMPEVTVANPDTAEAAIQRDGGHLPPEVIDGDDLHGKQDVVSRAQVQGQADDGKIHIDIGRAAGGIAATAANPEGEAATWAVEGVKRTASEKAERAQGQLDMENIADSVNPVQRVDDAKSALGNTVAVGAEKVLGTEEGDMDWLAEDIEEYEVSNPVGSQQHLAEDITDHLHPDNVEVSASKEGLEEGAAALAGGDMEETLAINDGLDGSQNSGYTDFGETDYHDSLSNMSGESSSDIMESAGGMSSSKRVGSNGDIGGSDEDDSMFGSSDGEQDNSAIGTVKDAFGPTSPKSVKAKGKILVALVAAAAVSLAAMSGAGSAIVSGISASNNNAVRAAASNSNPCSSGLTSGQGTAVNVSTNGSVGTGGFSSEEAHERARYIFSLLRGVGMEPHVAAGVLGNIQVETAGTFSPQIDNPNDVGQESFGIVQWRSGRRTAVEQYMVSAGVNPNASGFKQQIGGDFKPLDDEIKKALAAQVAYLAHENATSESGAWNIVKSKTTAVDVADAFDQYWERSDGGARATRKANANTIYNDFVLGNNAPSPDTSAQTILNSQGGGGGGDSSTVTAAPSGTTGCSSGSSGSSMTAGNGITSSVMTGTCTIATKEEDSAATEEATDQSTSSGGDAGNSGSTEATTGSGSTTTNDGTTRGGRRGRWQDWDPSVAGTSSLSTGVSTMTTCNGTYATAGSGNLSAAQLNGIISAAMSKQGSPYVWGAVGPNSFDCSGLVVWSFQQQGLSAPGGRVADQQGDATATVATGPLTQNISKAQPGDLLFWDYQNDAEWDHVAIYIGNGKMIHAPQPGDVVKVVDVYDSGAAMKIGRP